MLIFGHRGARGEAPENTLAGFRHAAEAGVTAVELDLRLSRDRQLMVIHDETVTRTTGRKGAVADLDAAQMAQMDARRDAPPWPDAQPIPVIGQVLDACPAIRRFQLELKSPPAALRLPTVEAMLELFRSRALHSRATLTSFDTGLLKALRARDPSLPLGVIADRARPDAAAVAKALGAKLIVLHWKLATRRRIAQAHADGLRVSAWTVNDESTARRLARDGIDSVVTDFPTRMLRLAASPAASPRDCRSSDSSA